MPAANRVNRPLRRLAIGYFAILTAMSYISFASPGLVYIAVFLFGLGLLIMFSTTLLLYSLSAVPIVYCLADRRRLRFLPLALPLPLLLAYGVPLLSEEQDRVFFARITAADFMKSPSGKPRVVEFVDVGMTGQDYSSIYLSLLFNHEVERVRVVQKRNKSTPASSRKTFWIEQKEKCPPTFAAHANNPAVKARIVAGECLIEQKDDRTPAQAVVELQSLADLGPLLARVERLRILTIEEISNDGEVAPIVRRTELRSAPIAAPFLVSWHGTMSSSDGPIIVRTPREKNLFDLAAMLRKVFGFAIGPISAPPDSDPRHQAASIMSSRTDVIEPFTPVQQSTINDAFALMAAQPTLSESEIDLIKRVITQGLTGRREDASNPALRFDALFHRHQTQLASLIPACLERIGGKDGATRGFRTRLAEVVAFYPTEVLMPYREKIRTIVESDTLGDYAPLLARIADFGDGAPLIAKGLRADRSVPRHADVRLAAAKAACRLPTEAARELKPVLFEALGHSALITDELVVLTLIRLGEKEAALTTFTTKWPGRMNASTREWIATLGPDFPVDQCKPWS